MAKARSGSWSIYDARLGLALVAPAVVLLAALLIAPVIMMGVYTFYTFVTAGVEEATLTLANWHEFLTDGYYHGFLWKTVRVGAMTAAICAVLGY